MPAASTWPRSRPCGTPCAPTDRGIAPSAPERARPTSVHVDFTRVNAGRRGGRGGEMAKKKGKKKDKGKKKKKGKKGKKK